MEDSYQDSKHSPTFVQRAFVKSCEIANESAEYFAGWSIGQVVLRQTDRLLWTVEKCAEWSVPTASVPKQSSVNGSVGKPTPLVRPLPWLLFLPMLLFLRIVRLSLNIGAMLIGMETIKPTQMVRFIQTRRRNIRALKFMGLRRIRLKKLEQQQKLSWKDTFCNIMSRAMCFRVTNSDFAEQLTIKKGTIDEPQTSKPKQKKPLTGQDLQRKYMEILKNNYVDFEDVETDEELIDRIMQLAEEDSDDASFMPAEDEEDEEDSVTEDDSMSDTEDDAIVSCPSPAKDLQRLPSYGSLKNEVIQEENEEEEDETISANSDDESSTQQIVLDEPQISTEVKHQDNNKNKNLLAPPTTTTTTTSDSATNSDEFYSPVHSISTSPVPKKSDENLTQNNKNNSQEVNFDAKQESEKLIQSEKIQDVNNG